MITDYLKYVNDQPYVVKRETPVHVFAKKGENKLNMELLQAWRDYLGCDHVLRTPTHFLMCETIEEAQILEENE
jgi:hypothetical protein|tara:strand:+ start:316 stop:537 length:222 start_codon:yes stop_codon:yes gene_type:complete